MPLLPHTHTHTHTKLTDAHKNHPKRWWVEETPHAVEKDPPPMSWRAAPRLESCQQSIGLLDVQPGVRIFTSNLRRGLGLFIHGRYPFLWNASPTQTKKKKGGAAKMIHRRAA